MANDYFYKNDYVKAMELYEQVVQKDQHNHQAFEKMAKIEVSRGNLTRATELYDKSLSIYPEEANTWNELGNVWFDMANYEKAIECYKKANEHDPDFYWAYYNVGLAMSKAWPDDHARRLEAKEWYEKAIKIKSDYYPALNEIGLYYMDNNDYESAEKYFFLSIEAYKAYKYPYYNLATIYKEKDQFDKAKEYLAKALQYSPDYVAALNNMGILFYREDNYMTALYYYTRALELDPSYKYALYNIGLVFDRMERYRSSYEMHRKVLEVAPDYDPAREEKERLEKEHPEEIKHQEPLSDKDLASETYEQYKKVFTTEEQGKDAPPVEKDKAEEKKEEIYIERFGRNITKLAREGKLFDIVGRDKEIQSLLEILFKMKKNNPLVIGKAGVGKTAIVEGLAQKIVREKVPEYFKKMEIIELNMGMVVAGTKYRGEFEQRLKKIIEDVKERDNIILFIDEIHMLVGAGSTEGSSVDAANILKPYLASGEIRCIGATTPEEYKKYIQKDKALERRFYKINIEELTSEVTLMLLRELKPRVEKHYQITIDDSLLDLIISLSDEEIKTRVFPDKAIDIMENSFSRCALSGMTSVDENTVRNIVSEFVGIKFIEAEEDQGRHLLQMESFLKERIYGQDEAIDKISKMIRLAKKRLDLKPYKPDGVFLFAGPTGVGKTFLAKQLSSFLYGSEKKLFTLNMSEFTEPHSVSKLIGSPPGYVGYDDVAFFSSTIMENPSSLLLVDEIEKTHPEVMKLFLQIFDEGKVTDSSGNVIYFSNVTIILTSNAVGDTGAPVGFGGSEEKPALRLTDVFPAEFVNRIDEVIVFNHIERDTAKRILENIIVKNAKKVFERKGISVEFNSTFIDHIVMLGYSYKFGVRNLERVFEKEVMASIANHLYSYPDTKKMLITVENGRVQVCDAACA